MRTANAYDNLMQFVSKNTAIPDGIERVRENRENMPLLETVKAAILLGTLLPTDDFFKHQDCELFILALLKYDDIEPMQAFCLLEYLQLLRQYEPIQGIRSFKKEDISTFSEMESAKITSHVQLNGNQLLKLAKTFSEILTYDNNHTIIPPEAIVDAYHTLTGCEKWVFEIRHNYSLPSYHIVFDSIR